MARVAVIIRNSPFRSRRTAEALRMAVGQTLSGNEVCLVLAGDAVYILGDAKPSLIGGGEVQRPLEALRMLGHRTCAEDESIRERGLDAVPAGVEIVSRCEVARILGESDVVIPW